MNSKDVRSKYIAFFVAQGHKEIPSARLVPENDPTTLFTSSGMQPLIPYLLGAPHPLGKRLVNSQKSFRAQDIEEVGDNRHTTFFEMLGNWSLGDYFKKEQLPWIFTFLTKELGLDPKRLYVTVFEGNEAVGKDTESIDIWKQIFASVGIEAKVGEKIFTYPAKKNWWSRSGEPKNMPPGEPGGPDSEVFYDFGEALKLHEKSPWASEPCHPNCDCGRFMEIANSVFMQYQKKEDGSLVELAQKNVDFGGGLERMMAAANNNPDVFRTDLFMPVIQKVEEITKQSYADDKNKPAFRVIADHIKAATLLIVDGVLPSNKGQGYILRRLLRRASVKFANLRDNPGEHLPAELALTVLDIYNGVHTVDKDTHSSLVYSVVEEEIRKFQKTIHSGLKILQKTEEIDGKSAFDLYQTYGFPLEVTIELLQQKGKTLDVEDFKKEFEKHKELSRSASKGMFKGGLADHSEQTTKLHTAHHLLLAALQKVVDPEIKQRGSNITAERLRIDVNFARKLTPEEIEKIEAMVNEKIQEKIPVTRVEMDRLEAEKIGAQREFGQKYPDRVSVYFVGPQENFFSAEFCGGPHVTNTQALGTFKIIKEESSGSGIRRIYGILQ
jgi:alanyl-tRNA synthetase